MKEDLRGDVQVMKDELRGISKYWLRPGGSLHAEDTPRYGVREHGAPMK